MFIIFIIIFVVIIDGAIKCNITINGKCSQHTEIYRSYNKDELKTLYLEKTYLPLNNLIDPCKRYLQIHRNKYIKELEINNIKCYGKWCIDGQYKCNKYNNTCWQVEHIIDSNNSPFDSEEYDLNIYGNIIMTYGVWNNQLGNKGWTIVESEKIDVYGNIFTKAMQNVMYCSNKSSEIIKKNNIIINEKKYISVNEMEKYEIIIYFIGISVMINIIFFMFIIRNCYNYCYYKCRGPYHNINL